MNSDECYLGFKHGAISISNAYSENLKGLVVLSLATKNEQLQIYVTKTGKVRIYDNNGEWKRSGEGYTLKEGKGKKPAPEPPTREPDEED